MSRDSIVEVIAHAKRLAAFYNEERYTSVHVMMALLGSPNFKIIKVLATHKIDLDTITTLNNLSTRSNRSIFSLLCETPHAELDGLLGSTFPMQSLTTFVASLLKRPTKIRKMLLDIGVEVEKLIMDISRLNIQLHTGKEEKNKTPNMDKFCVDLSAMATEGKLDLLIGRKREIERVTQVLSRRRKNNPVILGEAGVGKSALVEGLALSIHNKEVHCTKLHDKRIYILDMNLLVAGTQYRGMFEERLTGVVKELEDDPNAIAFIDEVHMIVQAGSCEGGQDAANMLKPALARGKLQVIGATTNSEYGIIKRDAALGRRFQPVVLDTLKDREILDILTGIKHLYEDYHGVKYSVKVLEHILKLSKDIQGRNAPDVQIDLMDEIGSSISKVRVTIADVDKVFDLQDTANQSKVNKLGF